MRRPVAILLAVALDLAAGEPPSRWHPVAWLGRALSWAERRAPGRSVADGAAAVIAVSAGAWAAGRLLAVPARRLGRWGVVLEACALKLASPCVD
jgi:adenosylcobinamide-phosphate synthase